MAPGVTPPWCPWSYLVGGRSIRHPGPRRGLDGGLSDCASSASCPRARERPSLNEADQVLETMMTEDRGDGVTLDTMKSVIEGLGFNRPERA